MSAIALPVLEGDLRAALARVVQGESLLVMDAGKEIAQISPPPATFEPAVSEQSLVDFFLSSPLRESGLVNDRSRDLDRPTVGF